MNYVREIDGYRSIWAEGRLVRRWVTIPSKRAKAGRRQPATDPAFNLSIP
jgi:hypothetical protein